MPVYTYDPAKCEEEFKLADVDKDGIPAGEDPEGDVWTTGFRLQALYNQGNTTRQVVSEILAGNLARSMTSSSSRPLVCRGLPSCAPCAMPKVLTSSAVGRKTSTTRTTGTCPTW